MKKKTTGYWLSDEGIVVTSEQQQHIFHNEYHKGCKICAIVYKKPFKK